MLYPNPFVYEQVYKNDISNACIPSILEEQYAQCGEDIIILSLIRAFGIEILKDKTVCIEIGANHAFAGSNTFLISKELGIKSILIEANPSLIEDLKKSRFCDKIINVAIVDNDNANVDFFVSNHNELSSLNRDFVENWHDGKVGVKSDIKVDAIRINKLLEREVGSNSDILLLSIDIEGMDLKIIKDLDFSVWRPMFVQMEPSEHFLQGESVNMVEHMNKNEYFLISRTKVNLIFIDRRRIKFFLNKKTMNLSSNSCFNGIENKANQSEKTKEKELDELKETILEKEKEIEILSRQYLDASSLSEERAIEIRNYISNIEELSQKNLEILSELNDLRMEINRIKSSKFYLFLKLFNKA